VGVKMRVLVAWALFIAWVTWLGWQSHYYGRFPVVSRSQFMTADVAVLAKMTANDEGVVQPKVQVKRVVWPEKHDGDLEGKEIVIGNWSRVDGFIGPGEYVIPLTRGPKGDYTLAEIPRSPLSEPSKSKHYIYPALPVVLEQARRIPPPSSK
jgi:hypothetical protein